MTLGGTSKLSAILTLRVLNCSLMNDEPLFKTSSFSEITALLTSGTNASYGKAGRLIIAVLPLTSPADSLCQPSGPNSSNTAIGLMIPSALNTPRIFRTTVSLKLVALTSPATLTGVVNCVRTANSSGYHDSLE